MLTSRLYESDLRVEGLLSESSQVPSTTLRQIDALYLPTGQGFCMSQTSLQPQKLVASGSLLRLQLLLLELWASGWLRLPWYLWRVPALELLRSGEVFPCRLWLAVLFVVLYVDADETVYLVSSKVLRVGFHKDYLK